MNHPEHSAKSPSPRTAPFALLRASLPTRGSSAPAAALLAALLTAALLALLPASALAAPSETFAGPGEGAGQLNAPFAVAVDSSTGAPTSGDAYVADLNNRRIDVFDPAGHFLLAFGFGVADGATSALQTCGPAASPPTPSCHQGLAGSAPGQIRPSSLAVDPASHNLYVSESASNRVQVFTPGGEFLLMFGSEVDKGPNHPGNVCTAADIAGGDVCGAGVSGSGPGAFQAFQLPLAVDAAGHLWVGDLNRLEQFSPQGAFLSQLPLAGVGAVQALAIDTSSSPSAGDFYLITPSTNEIQEFTPPTSGTYTLSFEGQTTSSLPFDAHDQLQPGKNPIAEALEALSSIGTGNVGVNLATGTTPRTIFFHGTLGHTDVPQIVPSAGSVTTPTQGVRGQLLKFGPAGEPLAVLDPGGHPNALGLDPASGNLFVNDQRQSPFGTPEGPATLLQFAASGAQTAAFGSGEVIGAPRANALAFGAQAQRLYVVSSVSGNDSAAQIFTLPPPGPLPIFGSSHATEVHKLSATLCARVNPEGAETKARFQYLTAATYQAQKAQAESEGKTPTEVAEAAFAGALQTPESASLGADFGFDHELCQPLSSLTSGTAYRFRVVAANENAPPGGVDGEAAGFETLPAAAVSAAVSAVTATSATLEAQINPLGDATSYSFQFLTEAEYQANLAAAQDPFAGAAQAPLQAAPIGSGSAAVSVSQHLQGLLPQTTYRYRVLATNHCNPVQPAETCQSTNSRAFITQRPASSATLPDARGWELVSPPDKHGAAIFPIGKGHPTKSAASGAALTYFANAPTEATPAGTAAGVQVLSSRGPTGWSSRDLAAPHRSATGVSPTNSSEYALFSADLSQSILQPLGAFEPALSPQASEQTPYLRTDFPPAAPTAFCGASCYTPLVTGCPEVGEPCPPEVEAAADVPPGTAFGVDGVGGKCDFGFLCGPGFADATPDLAHVVLSSSIGLTAAPGDQGGLYEWSALAPPSERLRPVSVLPGGAQVDAGLGRGGQVTRNAISSDGSRVFWTSAGHLYLRDLARGETVQLDAVQGGTGIHGPHAVEFQLASADGSRAFFLDEQQLTADSGAGEGNADLYECQIVTDGAGHLACDLTDLTPLSSTHQPAQVLKSVIGASEDGSSLYFLANGVLAANKVENGGGVEAAQPGSCGDALDFPLGATCSLYRVHQGTITFLATLSSADALAWGLGEDRLASVASRVSPNGRFLAFMSTRPLTGYDNRDARTGARDLEVYLYDARTERLICASCHPTGARPQGAELAALTPELNGGANAPNFAASLPSWTTIAGGNARYQPRYLSDDGRLFFNASDALVPQDTNGVNDVYQYEPPQGAEEPPPNDTCTAASPTYSPASQGCVDLISSGTSPTDSGFLDASESGNDVFFFTESRLTPADTDSARDVYDARSGGGEAEVLKPVECSGDACQQPAVPPNDPTPGSLTFNGAGNLVECPKGKVKKAGKCVAKHHKKKHPKKNKKRAHKRAASHNRGGTK